MHKSKLKGILPPYGRKYIYLIQTLTFSVGFILNSRQGLHQMVSESFKPNLNKRCTFIISLTYFHFSKEIIQNRMYNKFRLLENSCITTGFQTLL